MVNCQHSKICLQQATLGIICSWITEKPLCVLKSAAFRNCIPKNQPHSFTISEDPPHGLCIQWDLLGFYLLQLDVLYLWLLFLYHIFTRKILWSEAMKLGLLPVRVLWEWIINLLLPNYVIAAIKSSRCKPGTGRAYMSRVKYITLGALPAFILRDWDELKQQIVWRFCPNVFYPSFIGTLNTAYPEDSPKVMSSLCDMYKQFLRVYQAFSSPLLHLILRNLCEFGISSLIYKQGHQTTLWLTDFIKVTQPINNDIWM